MLFVENWQGNNFLEFRRQVRSGSNGHVLIANYLVFSLFFHHLTLGEIRYSIKISVIKSAFDFRFIVLFVQNKKLFICLEIASVCNLIKFVLLGPCAPCCFRGRSRKSAEGVSWSESGCSSRAGGRALTNTASFSLQVNT